MAENALGIFRCRKGRQSSCKGLLGEQAVRGASGNAQAVQWALRNRSRAASSWDHAHAKVEVSGPHGGAVQEQADLAVIDARSLAGVQRAVLKQALQAVKEQGKAVT